MAWTTPRTWVAGEIATASNLNTHVRDMANWCLTDAPMASVYNNADLTVTNNAWYTITCNSEYVDNCGAHSTSSSTSRLTVPTGGAGKYLMGSAVSVTSNATGIRLARIQLDAISNLIAVNQVGSAAIPFDVPIVTFAGLVAADYIETQVFQNSGGTLTASYFPPFNPTFWFTWIRS